MSKKNKHEDWANTIWIEPFDWPILLVTPSNFAKFKKHMKFHKCSKEFIAECKVGMQYAINGGGCFYSDAGCNYIMFLPDTYNETTTYHECLHAAVHLWDRAGGNIKLPRNDEVLTYTQGYIVRLVKAHLYPSKEE